MRITISRFLSGLREKGFSVSLSGGTLQFKGDATALSSDETRMLETRRDEILLFLRAHKSTAMPRLTADPNALQPSQAQLSWWRWVRQSPVQLSHERVPLVRFYAGIAPAHAEQAVRQMLTRHPVLRAHFSEQNGVLVVRLQPEDAFVIEAENTPAGLAPEAARNLITQRARDFIGQPLPVDGPWLFKAKIIAAPGEVAVALLFAHLIVDGVSSALLAAELDALLGDSQEAKAALEAPAAQFFDYAASEQAWLQGPQGAALTDYWLDWVSRQSDLKAPGSGAVLDWRPGLNVSHAFTIPGAVRDTVQALAARHRTSASSTFLTLFAMALARWSGQQHFPIRAVGNLRRTPALASTVGFMVCIDPIEVQVPPDADFASLLKSIAMDYYNAAMLRLPGFLKFPPQAAHPGVEQVRLGEAIAATFNFMPGPRPANEAQDADAFIWPPAVESVTRENWAASLWPVYLRLADVGNRTLGLFQFNEAIVSPADQAALMQQFFAAIAETALTA
jgi:hypothetical protein